MAQLLSEMDGLQQRLGVVVGDTQGLPGTLLQSG
jgi:hypothetical protein